MYAIAAHQGLTLVFKSTEEMRRLARALEGFVEALEQDPERMPPHLYQIRDHRIPAEEATEYLRQLREGLPADPGGST